ncbi:NERD domain-containing protein [Shewanella psychropiezotolerans]|uniref:NERD domain-containing protein n=1 Tax=Shewanella psychropiezotolerans TaxID=2593655 RepID=A0ABX5WT65_9GAMM|nr:nuclease-related domain-containing protein [Shewanella psychropiezotolerans]QDO82283.1 NERD domain-containing protein [Shewanella psychropiezotolerans]
MILKTKRVQNTKSPQAIAGQQQETNVAFFLRRAYKDNQQVLVINDFKFTFNDETAQIDHLIIYPYGFVLIESKSIKGHVKVNKQGEWTRSHNKNWQGMASPIKQVELQQALLKELLRAHKNQMLGKLLGIKQQGFGMRCWDHLCAISSDAVIDRKNIPTPVSEQLVKSEFLVEKLNKLMNIRNRFMRLVNISDTRPNFSQAELESIGTFLLEQNIEKSIESKKTIKETTPAPSNPQQIQVPVAVYQSTTQKTERQSTQHSQSAQTIKSELRCKHCGESTNYTPMYGKFGYYVKCNICTKNTPMKQACPKCQSKNTKVQKRRETYTLNCQECGCTEQVV